MVGGGMGVRMKVVKVQLTTCDGESHVTSTGGKVDLVISRV